MEWVIDFDWKTHLYLVSGHPDRCRAMLRPIRLPWGKIRSYGLRPTAVATDFDARDFLWVPDSAAHANAPLDRRVTWHRGRKISE